MEFVGLAVDFVGIGESFMVKGFFSGGRGGIRTHGTIARTPDFESGAFDQLSHPSIASKMRKRKIAEIVGLSTT
jgi:hypothetical protein